MKIPARVEEGNPKNWPRQIARKYPRTLDATSKLLEKTNEMNIRFAVTEFVFEREAMERAAAAALCREAGCICGRLAETDRWYFESAGGRAVYHWGPAGKIWEINEHAGICFYALAAKIEAQATGLGARQITQKEE